VERPRDHAPTLQHSAPRCNSVVGAHRQYDVPFLVCFWRGREAPADGWAPLPGQPGPFWQMVGVARQEESASDEASADRHCAGTCRICDGGVAALAPSSKPVPIACSGASHTTARSIHWVQCAPDLGGSTIDVTRARLLVIGARARRPAGGVPHERRARAPHICQESRMVPADTGRHFHRPPGTTKPRSRSGLSLRFERRARSSRCKLSCARRPRDTFIRRGRGARTSPARADALFAAPGFSRRVARAQR